MTKKHTHKNNGRSVISWPKSPMGALLNVQITNYPAIFIYCTEVHYFILLNRAGWVPFSCFHNPPNSDMDWLGSLTCVRDRSFLCVRYTHTGGWLEAHRQRVSTTFLAREKLSNFSCAPDGVRTRVTDVIESSVPRSLYDLPTEPPRHPSYCKRSYSIPLGVQNSFETDVNLELLGRLFCRYQ